MTRARNNFSLIFFGAVAVFAATVFAYVMIAAPGTHAEEEQGRIVGRVIENVGGQERWWGPRDCPKENPFTLADRLHTNNEIAVHRDFSAQNPNGLRLDWFCDFPLPSGVSVSSFPRSQVEQWYQFYASDFVPENSQHNLIFRAPTGYKCAGYSINISGDAAGGRYVPNNQQDKTFCATEQFTVPPVTRFFGDETRPPALGEGVSVFFQIIPRTSAPTPPTTQGRIVGRVREVATLHEPIAASTYVGPNANCPARPDGRSKVVPVLVDAQTGSNINWWCDRPIADPELYQFYGTELLAADAPPRTVTFESPAGYACVGWTKTTNGVTTNSAFDDPGVGPNRAAGSAQRCDVSGVAPGTMTQRLNDLNIPPVASEGTHLWFEIQPISPPTPAPTAPSPAPTVPLAILSFTARSARDPNSTVVASGEDGILRWNVTGASGITVSFGCKDGVEITTRGIILACGVEHDISGLGFNAAGGIRLVNTSAGAQNIIFTLTARDANGQLRTANAALTVTPRVMGRIVGRVFEQHANGTTMYWGAYACPRGLNPTNPDPNHFWSDPSMQIQALNNAVPIDWWCDFPRVPSDTNPVGPEFYQFYATPLMDAGAKLTLLYTAPDGYVCKGWAEVRPGDQVTNIRLNSAEGNETCVARDVVAAAVRRYDGDTQGKPSSPLQNEGTHLWFKIARQEDTFVITPASASARVGDTRAFTALYDPDGPAGPQSQRNVSGEVDWSSGDAAIAALDRVAENAATFRGVRTGAVTVTARIAGCERCSGTATARFTVTAVPNISPEIVNGECRTYLIASSNTTVTEEFAANVSDPDAQAPAACAFNFGDGAAETTPEQAASSGSWRVGVCRIQHTYTRQSTRSEFGVTLQATDEHGAQSTEVQCRPSAVVPALGETPPPEAGTTPSSPAGSPPAISGGGGGPGSGGSSGGGAPVCGNGIQETGEGCDDGNTTNFDGCASTCQLETPTVPPGGGSGGRGGGVFSGTLDVVPDSVTIRASTTAQFRAFFSAVGSGQRVDETNTSDLIWEVADADIAENLGAGRFHGRRTGTTRVSAHFQSASWFSDSAELVVLPEGAAGVRPARGRTGREVGDAPTNLSADMSAYCAVGERVTFSWDAGARQDVFELRVATNDATGDDGGLSQPVFLQTTAAKTLSTPPRVFALDTDYVWQARALARSGDLSAPQFVVPLAGVGETRHVTDIAPYRNSIYLAVSQDTESPVAAPSLYQYDPTQPNKPSEAVRLDRVDAPSAFRRLDDRAHTLIPFRDSLLLATAGSGAQAVYAYDGERAQFLFQLPGGVKDAAVFGGRLYLIATGDSSKIYVYDGVALSVAFDDLVFQEARVDGKRYMVSRSTGSSGSVRAAATALAVHGGKLAVAIAFGGNPYLVELAEGQTSGRELGRFGSGVGFYFFDGTNWEFPQALNWEGRRPRLYAPIEHTIVISALASYGSSLYAGAHAFRTRPETGFVPEKIVALYAIAGDAVTEVRDPAFSVENASITNLVPIGDLLLAAMRKEGVEGNEFYLIDVSDPTNAQFTAFAEAVGEKAAFQNGSLYLFSAVTPRELLRYDVFGFSPWSELARFRTPRSCARGLFRIFDFFREI